jgi:hypothetical protein
MFAGHSAPGLVLLELEQRYRHTRPYCNIAKSSGYFVNIT